MSVPDVVNDRFYGIHSGNSKIVVSLDRSEKSYYIIDTGNSGNILSRHYDD